MKEEFICLKNKDGSLNYNEWVGIRHIVKIQPWRVVNTTYGTEIVLDDNSSCHSYETPGEFILRLT